MSDTTVDPFLNGRIRVAQNRDGYRFSIDAILLAAAVRPRIDDTLVDLGTGCGIIPLILGCRYPKLRIHAVELQEALATLARDNVAANHMQDRIVVVRDDVRKMKIERYKGPWDWVISNPPFYPTGAGRINPNDQKASARHEIHLNLTDLLKSVRRMLRTGGRFVTIYPSERSATLLSQMCRSGIEPKWMRTIHSHSGDPAQLILVQGVMAGKAGLKVDRPLVLYEDDGAYTKELQAMMDG